MTADKNSKQVLEAIAAAGPIPDYMLIGGKRVRAGDGTQIPTRDPGSGETVSHVPAGTVADMDRAVASARQAFKGPWSRTTPKDRGRLLADIGRAIATNSDRLALVETLDTGKPLRDAMVSVRRTSDYFHYYAGLVDKPNGESIPLGPGKISFTERVPIGVTGHIIPWNVPISMVARSVAPALACGNTVVVKPAEFFHAFLQPVLAGMAEGRVADVVRQRNGFRQILIQVQMPRQ